MTIRFWGVRGSYSTANPAMLGYGGNTPCVEVRVAGRVYILDAGTGLIGLGKTLAQEGVRDVTLFLSHFHTDHIEGFPFFSLCHDACARITIYSARHAGRTGRSILDGTFRPPLFPFPKPDFHAAVAHRTIAEGATLTFPGDLRVATTPLNHPDGATGFCFRTGTAAFAYLSDVEHADGPPDATLVDFVRGADCLIYDATYDESEYGARVGWGHSTAAAGLRIAEAAGVRRFIAFHHNPEHDDSRLYRREQALRAAAPQSCFAHEGMEIVI